MSGNGPLISSAGRNHVLLSKQFCIVLSKFFSYYLFIC
jgi:hypothetical protein